VLTYAHLQFLVDERNRRCDMLDDALRQIADVDYKIEKRTRRDHAMRIAFLRKRRDRLRDHAHGITASIRRISRRLEDG
jgi:hypothetical protein